MEVTLFDYTDKAVEKLIFTKSTRLEMNPGLLEEIDSWPEEKKQEELAYIAKTNPGSWEFVHYSFLITGVSRAFTHQLVRTRNASYAQQSMRISNMADFDFIFPERIDENNYAAVAVGGVLSRIKEAYRELLYAGIPPEDARSILPTNISTNICMSINLRNLVQLVKSRLGGRTQGEYREVAEKMVDAVLEVHPWARTFFFGDVGRDYFKEIEAFAEEEYGGDLVKKGKLLKIVDSLRQSL